MRRRLSRRIAEAVKGGPIGLLSRCSRRVAERVFGGGSARAEACARLPYQVYFFSAVEPVRVRATYSPLPRRARRCRRHD